jgi:hypothetical protein
VISYRSRTKKHGAMASGNTNQTWSRGKPPAATRHSLGYWLGYVGVPPDHPLHGAGLNVIAVRDLRVHNGPLNFADQSAQGQIAPLSEPAGCWWFGFDCGQPGQGDLAPGFLPGLRAANLPGDLLESHEQWLKERKYRNLCHVKEQCGR